MEDKILENENIEEPLVPEEDTFEPENECDEVTDAVTEEIAEETSHEELPENAEESVVEEEAPVEDMEDDTQEASTQEEEPEIVVAPTEKEQPIKEKNNKSKKKEKKEKKTSFGQSDVSDTEEVKGFTTEINIERIIDKVCLVLLLLALAIPVGLLGYVIYIIVSFFL